MTDIERADFEYAQDTLMEMYNEVEANPEQYSDQFQSKLNSLDDLAEHIRGLLGGRWE